MTGTYLTKDKYEELQRELEERKDVVRLEIAEGLKKAKDHGDLSENAEYQDIKDAQGRNENRILELEQILDSVEIIDKQCVNKESVGIGCEVSVVNEDGQREFTIVGPYDADPSKNFISNESPMGEAFMARKVGDEVEVKTPKGIVKYKIVKIN